VERNPNNTAALAHLGMALYRRQRYEDAVEPLEKAISQGAENEAYYYTLGLSYVYGEPRQCDKAIPWLEKALEINPYSQPALSGLRTCEENPEG
jgi:tetratricopeptide (TPR) repeat protein